MAKRPKEAVEIIEKEALEYVTECYRNYGVFTLENRALPDYRDGLLKVYRRTLWSMSHIAPNNKPHVKTARVSGDVIGKYHPHGNAAVDSAIETMVNMANPLAHGVGNWGGQTDSAAASRYTNVRLSDFAADTLLHPDYMSVIDYVPNYDGKDKEPVLLPALLPNVLLNNTYGIAVGLSTHTPAFEVDGIKKVLKGMLKGKKLTTSAALKSLKLTFPYGGYAPLDEEWQRQAKALIEKGKASIYVYCEYDFDTKGELNITAVPPRMSPDTLIAKLSDTGFFSAVADVMGNDTETHAHIKCVFKRGTRLDDVAEWCDENLYSSVPYQIAVIERHLEEDGTISADVHQWGVIELLENWLKWRTELEVKMLNGKAKRIKEQIERKNLLLLAQKNRAVIAKSWEAESAVEYLCDNIEDLSEEEAKEILALRISQLSKLDREKLLREIKELKASEKEAKQLARTPEVSILESLG